jgi:hypothetical protein
VNVVIGTDPVTFQPVTHAFPCCIGVDLEASVTVYVGSNAPTPLNYCTETHFENNSPAAQAEFGFYQGTFGGGFTIGAYTPGNGNTAPNGFTWAGNGTGQAALKSFITGGGGTDGALTKDLVNPTSGSGGSLGRHAVTLMLNVGFSGVITNPPAGANWPAGFGLLIVNGIAAPLNGTSINNILAVANQALANGTLPGSYSFSDLSKLLDELNKSFNDCHEGAWASQHLSAPQP